MTQFTLHDISYTQPWLQAADVMTEICLLLPLLPMFHTLKSTSVCQHQSLAFRKFISLLQLSMFLAFYSL